MKRTEEILNLPLICINEGCEYGRIKRLLVNPDTGKVEYMVIDDGQWYMEAKLLPFDKVMGIGSDAVTTETEDNIKNLNELEEALELAKKNIGVVGTKVYTKSGQYIGRISEYYINEDDGSIVGCELSDEGERKIIPASSVVTYGKGVLVVVENVLDTLIDKPEAGENAAARKRPVSSQKPELKGKSESDETDENEMQSDSNANVSQQKKVRQSQPEQTEAQTTTAGKLFEQRQRQFLLGRKSTKKIVNDAGEVLVNKGDVITDEIIDKVKESGKLIELTMNTRP